MKNLQQAIQTKFIDTELVFLASVSGAFFSLVLPKVADEITREVYGPKATPIDRTQVLAECVIEMESRRSFGKNPLTLDEVA